MELPAIPTSCLCSSYHLSTSSLCAEFLFILLDQLKGLLFHGAFSAYPNQKEISSTLFSNSILFVPFCGHMSFYFVIQQFMRQEGRGMKRADPRTRPIIWILALLFTICVTSLSLSFSISKMEKIIVLPLWINCKDYYIDKIFTIWPGG